MSDIIGNVTVIDTSQKSWNTTPARLINTRQHRMMATPEASTKLDAAQRVQSAVYDAVAGHLVRHPSKPWIAPGGAGRDSILKWLTRERKTRPEWQTTTVAVLRGAARDAFEATQRWDMHQQELAETVLAEHDAEERIRRGEGPPSQHHRRR